MDNDKFMSSVKVGPKGQIVIPCEIRKMFGIESGDTLLIMATKENGIGLTTFDTMSHIISTSTTISKDFINAVKSVEENRK
jgi:looped-hinge helix DNA binding domain, AbrB family